MGKGYGCVGVCLMIINTLLIYMYRKTLHDCTFSRGILNKHLNDLIKRVLVTGVV